MKSITPVPIGVGIIIAGGNDDIVRHNHIYDNWRRGTMLLAVPDAISCAPRPDERPPPCTPQARLDLVRQPLPRQRHGPRARRQARCPTASTSGGTSSRATTATAGTRTPAPTARSRASPPTRAPPPTPGTPVPGFLPQDCGSPLNVGTGNPPEGGGARRLRGAGRGRRRTARRRATGSTRRPSPAAVEARPRRRPRSRASRCPRPPPSFPQLPYALHPARDDRTGRSRATCSCGGSG